MITRTHAAEGTFSEAVYSPCERYRYGLSRVWAPEGRRVLFVMLNPSRATELQNDPTIERCERRARALGYGGFKVCNIFAWREKSPALLKRAAAPVGPENDALLDRAAKWADDVICAWGVHGAHLGRGPATEARLRAAGHRLLCFGTTKDGHPRHPLYVAYKVTPEPWSP